MTDLPKALDERTAKALEKSRELPEEQLLSAIRALTDYLNFTGEFIYRLGDLEEKHGKVWALLTELSRSPQFLFDLIERLPLEVAYKLLKLFMQLYMISERTRDFVSLSSEEKKRLGQELKRLSKSMKRLLKNI